MHHHAIPINAALRKSQIIQRVCRLIASIAAVCWTCSLKQTSQKKLPSSSSFLRKQPSSPVLNQPSDVKASMLGSWSICARISLGGIEVADSVLGTFSAFHSIAKSRNPSWRMPLSRRSRPHPLSFDKASSFIDLSLDTARHAISCDFI